MIPTTLLSARTFASILAVMVLVYVTPFLRISTDNKMSGQPSENPKFKLVYFNVTALGEPLRFLFAYGGIEYEDVRVDPADWPALKATMPLAQMPVLEVDGHRMIQSNAIGRYLAKRVGLYGSNDWENFHIDVMIDTISEFRLKITMGFNEKDEAIKKRNLEQIKSEVLPFYLEKLDQIAKENNGHFALGRLTWADINFAGILDYVNYMVGFDVTENWPNLKRVVENVHNVDSIKAYLAKRPKTPF